MKSNEEIGFWLDVDRKGKDECWEWLGPTTRDRYGYGAIRRFGTQGAHRVAWIYTHGSISENMKVLHGCDNYLCCNPRHLFLGTNAINSMDMRLKGRQSKHEKNNNSKLTHLQIEEIRKLYSEGITQVAIAIQFGIRQNWVSKIVNYRGWM